MYLALVGRAQMSEFYLRSRFVAYAPDVGEVVTLSEAYQDPFSGSLILSRGYEVDQRTLFERLGSTDHMTIYLIGRSRTCRPLDISYGEVINLIPTLCGHEGGIAIDSIELKNPLLSVAGEIQVGDLPLPLRRVELLRPFHD